MTDRTTLRVWKDSSFRDFPNSYGHVEAYGDKAMLVVQSGRQLSRAIFHDWRYMEYIEPPKRTRPHSGPISVD